MRRACEESSATWSPRIPRCSRRQRRSRHRLRRRHALRRYRQEPGREQVRAQHRRKALASSVSPSGRGHSHNRRRPACRASGGDGARSGQAAHAFAAHRGGVSPAQAGGARASEAGDRRAGARAGAGQGDAAPCPPREAEAGDGGASGSHRRRAAAPAPADVAPADSAGVRHRDGFADGRVVAGVSAGSADRPSPTRAVPAARTPAPPASAPPATATAPASPPRCRSR